MIRVMSYNILFIERELDPNTGGVQRVTHILGEGLRNKGFNTWYAFHDKKSDTNLISDERKLIYDINSTQQDITEIFSCFIKNKNIDILFCQNVYTVKMCNVYKEIKRMHHVKIIACLHANPDRTTNKNSFRLTPIYIYIKDILKTAYYSIVGNAFIEEMQRVYELCDRYVLLSKRFIPVFIDTVHPDDDSKISGINNPCSFLEYKADNVKDNTVLVVARMEEGQKRISNILMVWSLLFKKYEDWTLVLVGNGKDLTHYKEYIKTKGIERVNFIGASNKVQQYYSTGKIFLMTSIWEGLPMTLIEAQSFGCVPVAFDNFAALHDIVNGTNGVCVKSNNLKSFVIAVEDLMDHAMKLKEMSMQAIKTSRNHFDVNRILNEWCHEFDLLFGKA